MVFTSEYEHDPSMTFHPSTEEVGVDLGITSFAVFSDGSHIENPRLYRNEEEQIKQAHKRIHRRKKGSHRRARAKKVLSRLYHKVRNRRQDFLHKTSSQLAKQYGTLVFEDLHIKNMTKRPKPKQDEETGAYLPNGAAGKSGLNKSILDAGWGAFVTMTSHKAEEAGGKLVKISPKNTSQQCSGCKKMVKKDLSVRWHSCPYCGAELDRDHNAAMNILARYQEQTTHGAGRVPQSSLVDGL